MNVEKSYRNSKSTIFKVIYLDYLENIFNMASRRAMSTLNPQEIKKFETIAADWWNLNGPAKGLHSMNGVRVPFVTEGLSKMGEIWANIRVYDTLPKDNHLTPFFPSPEYRASPADPRTTSSLFEGGSCQ